MTYLLLALVLSAAPKPFKPHDFMRGKVTLPVLGLELDLTPAAGGMAGASWRLTSELDVEQRRGWDILEARMNDVVVGVAEVRAIRDNDCASIAVGAEQKMITTVAGTWLHWEGLTEGVTWHSLCLDATEQHPAISIQRRWLDAKWKLPGEDDPVMRAVAFALRDGRYGKARPLLEGPVVRGALAPKTVMIDGKAVAAPNDGTLWHVETRARATVLERVLPVLPRVSLVIQKSADPALCPVKLKRGQWGSLGPTMRCRPLPDGALLVDLRGPSDLTTPWLDRL